MRKRIIDTRQPEAQQAEPDWLQLAQIAAVEVTSEEAAHSVENALLLAGDPAGWRAGQPGVQIIRLIFDSPQILKRIRLVFIENEGERTQEFVLRWSADGGQSWREIVRQQWNFSPAGTTQELEDYRVELVGVTQLELSIVPDVSGGPARASLAQLRLA
jgi:hypothetical protein